jgi:hypothetical protein
MTITVNPVVVPVDMRVTNIAMSLSANSRTARAVANVSIFDNAGLPVTGATVTGTWSGVVSGTGSAITASTGVASLTSPSTKSRGTFTFTVTGVSLSGYSYQPSSNVETADSITR